MPPPKRANNPPGKALSEEVKKPLGGACSEYYSEQYQTFSGVLKIRTVRAEYLAAMKPAPGRQYEKIFRSLSTDIRVR